MSCSRHEFETNGEFSKAIINISKWINEKGFSLDLLTKNLPENVAGRIDYETRLISINCYCAGCALIAIAHEAGHLEYYLKDKFKNKPSKFVREQEASRRGLKILRQYISEKLISDKEWLENQ